MFLNLNFGSRHVRPAPLSFLVIKKNEGKSEIQLKNVLFRLHEGKFPDSGVHKRRRAI